MNDPSLPQCLGALDRDIQNLREQIKKKEADPVAIGSAVAGIYLDNIARIRSYLDQLDRLTGYQLFTPGVKLVENFARACAILRISGKLSAMLVEQLDRFLKCFGGTQAIAIQRIVTWAREDPTRGRWLMAFAAAARSRRRS